MASRKKAAKRGFGQISQMRSGRFQARYTGPDQDLHTPGLTFSTREQAEAWLARERGLIVEGRWSSPADRRAAEKKTKEEEAQKKALTLAVYCERVIQRRERRARKPIAPTTAELYRKDLRLRVTPYLGDRQLDELTASDVEAWWDRLCRKKKKTPTSDGRAYETLRSILDEAVRSKLIPENPCQVEGAGKPSAKNPGESLTVDEVLSYLGNVAKPERRLALMTAAWCGLRSGEVRALRRCDVDLANQVIHVRQGVTKPKDAETGERYWRIAPPKTAAGVRDVHIPRVMVEPMRTRLRDLPLRGREQLIFPARDGVTALSSSTLADAHYAARKAIGRPHLRIHDLRRTAATLAAQDGATIRELMRLLGHTTAQVAMLYQTADDERDKERASRLDARIAGVI